MNISDLVRQKAQSFTLTLPEPKPGRKWVRLDCPFCKGKRGNSAAINYDAGWFECYRCRTRITAKTSVPLDSEIIERFNFQILYVVQKVKAKFGSWINEDDAKQKARLLVSNYSRGNYGGKNDAGMLDDWEADVMGDPDRLERYVSKALYGDLMNWARDQKRWKEKSSDALEAPDTTVRLDCQATTNANGTQYQESDFEYVAQMGLPTDDGQEYGGGWDIKGSSPKPFGMWKLALDERFPFNAWGSETLGCEYMRNGRGPWKGHCRYCDRAIWEAKNSTVDALWARKYRERMPVLAVELEDLTLAA